MSAPWMPLYVADYLADTNHLSTCEHGAYILLLMHYWRVGGLPDDDRQLARITRQSERQWRAMRPTIEAFFGENWTHGRVEKEREKAAEKAEKRSDAGSRGGSAKALKTKKRAVANATILPEQTDGNALASSSDIRSHKEESLEPSALRAASARRNPWPADFGVLVWQRYPKRVDKKAGMAALETEHRRDRLPWGDLIDGIDRLIANTEPQFVPSLERWLKKERWNDEYGRRPTGPPRQSQPTFADIARDFDHQMQGSPDDPSRDEATTRWDANAPGADGRRDGPPVPQPPRLAGRSSGPDLDLVVAGPYDR